MTKIYSLIIIFSFVSSTHCRSTQLHHNIYLNLEVFWPCVRRANASHSVGCSSSLNGNVGVVHLAFNQDDFDWVVNSAPMSSYIVVVGLNLFKPENLRIANGSSKVVGILLSPYIMPKSYYNSPEFKCPNPRSNYDYTCMQSWNPLGTGILWEKWDFPIFFSDDRKTISEIDLCFQKFNLPSDSTQSQRPLCALELNSYMFLGGTTLQCLKRSENTYSGFEDKKFCALLEGQNILVPLIWYRNFSKQPYIIFAVRQDSASFFFGLAPSALSTVTSLVTLIMTSQLLYEMTSKEDISKFDKNVLFVFFNGEAYDYIGSSRMSYNMKKGKFPSKQIPIQFEDVILYVELSQIINGSQIFVHNETMTSYIDQFLNEFESVVQNLKYDWKLNVSSQGLVPSSLQSFLKFDPKFPGIVFSSYDTVFTNKFYHSIFDNKEYVQYKYNQTNGDKMDLKTFISQLATSLAHTLYKLLSNKTASNEMVVNKTVTDEVLRCYFENFHCNLFPEIDLRYHRPLERHHFYIGVRGFINIEMILTKTILTVFMSINQTNITTKTECLKKVLEPESYRWFPEINSCLKSNVHSTDASSPAFFVKNYDIQSGFYSTWSESLWEEPTMRLFVKPSPFYEKMIFIFGLASLIISFIIIRLIFAYSKELFSETETSME